MKGDNNMSVCKKRAWETLTKLSFERIAGTEEEKRAAEMILEEMQKAGVDACIEEFEIDMPEITEVKFAVTKPEYKEYHCIGIGKSGTTPDEGITAPFAYIENALDANLTDIKGKIVLVTGRLMGDATEKLAKAGALGYIATHGSLYDEEALVKELRPRNSRGKGSNLPGIVIHITDAEELVRSRPEEVTIVLKQDADKKGISRNVVGTIEGTDLKDEIIVFTGHFDSVAYSTGAWDNMTGTINVLELMHHFKENQPRRTMRFVACGSEEIGCIGSREYCNKHKDELDKHIFNINFDMTGVTLGYEAFCCSASDEVKHAVEYLAKLEGYAMDSKMDMYPSDSSSFASAGVPACTFARLQCPGGAQIHNRYDVLDRLDPDSFMITLNFALKLSEQIANSSVNLIPRKFSDELKKKMEERKKMMAKMMGEEKKEEPKKEEPKEDKK